MKNVLAVFLLLVFMLPAFGPWMPQGTLATLHIEQEKHHQDIASHDHDAYVQDFSGHSVHLDVVTYFNDYLHVDLKNADNVFLAAPSLDVHAVTYAFVTDSNATIPVPVSDTQTTGPPDKGWLASRTKLPVYFATQRLRI